MLLYGVLDLANLRFSYPGSSFALRVDSLHVAPGKPLVILGPSGGGKTTLLRLMSGLLAPAAGSVRLGQTALLDLAESARRQFRLRHMGLIFQDFALLDYLTVEENVLLPHRFSGLTKDVAQRGFELAGQLDLGPHWRRLAGKLSQGERQRVAIARALAHQPRFVFADEPTASLDAGRRTLVMDLLLDYARQTQACLVMVTHDPELMPLFPLQVRVEDYLAQ